MRFVANTREIMNGLCTAGNARCGLAEQPGKARARFQVPGLLQVKPREDGRLTVTAGVAIKAKGRWKRAKVRIPLEPDEKQQNETIFISAEIVRSFGTDPADWDDPGWD